MTESVKPRRSYKSPLRAAQAEQTRARVLSAAGNEFAARGWTGTTIAGIARAAGVSAETIYAGFGSKATILEALIQHSLRGADPGTPLMDQREPRAITASMDQAEQICRFATDITAVLGRVAPLVAVARTAAQQDPELHALYLALHAGRRRNLALVVESLARNGPLRRGLTVEAAIDDVFRLVSPELYLLLIEVEGLDSPAVARWIEDALARLLTDRA